MKITFMGAGSSIFVKNVLGDSMMCEALKDAEFALYDIDPVRLEESRTIIEYLNQTIAGGKAKVTAFLGVENRKDALRNANFVINAIQVGGYEPSTVIDFEIPKKYGLRQTIGDTLGIGGIFRALRTEFPIFPTTLPNAAASIPAFANLDRRNLSPCSRTSLSVSLQ